MDMGKLNYEAVKRRQKPRTLSPFHGLMIKSLVMKAVWDEFIAAKANIP